MQYEWDSETCHLPKKRRDVFHFSESQLRVQSSIHLGTLVDLIRIARGNIGAVHMCKYPVDKYIITYYVVHRGLHGLSCIKKKGTFCRRVSKRVGLNDFT